MTMTLPDYVNVIFGLICVNLLIGAQAVTVYMNEYAHCIKKDFTLDGEKYTVNAKGGNFRHETLVCDLTFRARSAHAICITFDEFHINDCTVKLKIFDKNTSSGRSWRTLTCEDDSPKQMCTGARYVTVQLTKEKLNKNKNYNFQLHIQESDSSFTGEDVFFASIGIFVAIIVGVIVLIIIIAVAIICCCCKKKKRERGPQYQATSTAPPPQVQPSAPPAPTVQTDYFANQNMYPAIPPQYHPSEAPPPYSTHAPGYSHPGYATQPMYPVDLDTKQPMV
ncbi:uncharacterized protein LOC124146412 [Haliotis rufescens]|uniref:uncharacterized protein LOC124146412 n=1 Tax=Haliotis rufescens TaxID=6454 RepID=UPI001EAFC090|nr:uncharacterized protein LOC124146412 [Haliotis rufescens]XP_046372643.1 uncharacterized protein LOC124146412 [Haliotis rufescens]XP_046372644.1 uncharacterized protein LOC124146412 [Haliotis rufescens]XP_048257467.1 uncharacterized protein LOC124146412 [Haliotis rufescens]